MPSPHLATGATLNEHKTKRGWRASGLYRNDSSFRLATPNRMQAYRNRLSGRHYQKKLSGSRKRYSGQRLGRLQLEICKSSSFLCRTTPGRFLQASFGGLLVGTVSLVPGGTLKRSEVPKGSLGRKKMPMRKAQTRAKQCVSRFFTVSKHSAWGGTFACVTTLR